MNKVSEFYKIEIAENYMLKEADFVRKAIRQMSIFYKSTVNDLCGIFCECFNRNYCVLWIAMDIYGAKCISTGINQIIRSKRSESSHKENTRRIFL